MKQRTLLCLLLLALLAACQDNNGAKPPPPPPPAPTPSTPPVTSDGYTVLDDDDIEMEEPGVVVDEELNVALAAPKKGPTLYGEEIDEACGVSRGNLECETANDCHARQSDLTQTHG